MINIVAKYMNRLLLPHRNQTGLSMVELLVTLAILMFVIGSLYTLLVQGQDIFSTGDKQVGAQQQARIAMMRVVKEARQGYSLVDTGTYPSPPTSATSLSVQGVQKVDEVLTVNVGAQTASSNFSPWLNGATPVIHKGSAVLATSAYSIDYVNGIITNLDPTGSPWAAGEIKASFTWDVYLQYVLESSDLKRKVFNKSTGAVIESQTVLGNVANGATAIFSRDSVASPNVISVTFIADEDPSEPPAAFRLETDIRMRNQ